MTSDIEKAQALATQGLELAREAKYRYVIGWAQRALGRISLAREAFSEATIQLNDALETFASAGARYDLGRTHLDLATLAHAQGNRGAVTTHLNEARRLFEALRVLKYVARTEQLAGKFGVHS